MHYSVHAQENRMGVERGIKCYRCGSVWSLVHDDEGRLVCVPVAVHDRYRALSCNRVKEEHGGS